MKLLYLLMLLCLSSCVSHSELDQNKLYEKMTNASLVVLVNGRETGSGAFISKDGLVATAAHCIRFRDDKLELVSPVLGRMDASFVALDKAHDFLLLKADLNGKIPEFLPPTDVLPKALDKIFQMGSPIYRRGVVQTGMIARNDLYYEFYGEQHNHYIEILHVSASIQGGTSGGPWVNEKGEFIGIQSGTLLIGDSPSGLAFMSPFYQFSKVVKTQKSAQSYNLDFKVLPLEAHDPGTIKRYKGVKEGLVVSEISSESLASSAGLNKWDLIVAVDGVPLKDTKELIDYVRETKAKTVDFTVLVLDEEKSISKTIPVEIVEDRILFRNAEPVKTYKQVDESTSFVE